jgi:enoyl-CoA hydratase/carnithine racemase
MGEEVSVDAVGATRVVTIRRAHARNALTRDVLRKMTAAIDAAGGDPAVRCVVVAGEGDHFCAGADLRQSFIDDPHLLEHVEVYMDDFHGLIRSLVRCEKPTIARMDGAAVGFGADLAFACDLRVVSTRAYAQEKFVRIGMMPDGGGTFWLPRLLGTARAMQMILLADRVEAAELHRLGVAVEMVAPEALSSTVTAIARRIESGPPLAHAAIKKALYASLGDLDAALRREREGQLALLRSRDVMEGVAAWMEKREPSFEVR